MKWCGLIDERMPAFFVECQERGLHPKGVQASYSDHQHLNVKLPTQEFFSNTAAAAAKAAFPLEMRQDWMALRHAMFNTITKRRRRAAR